MSASTRPAPDSLHAGGTRLKSATGPRSPRFGRSAAALASADRARGWAPIIAALAIDLADLAMIGPTGLVFGLGVGFVLTTVVARASGASRARAFGLGLLGAVYCAMPVTDVVPVATMLTLVHVAIGRLRPQPEALAEAAAQTQPQTARVVQLGAGPSAA